MMACLIVPLLSFQLAGAARKTQDKVEAMGAWVPPRGGGPTECNNYSVKFKLSSMHSYFTVPTCQSFRHMSMSDLPTQLPYCGSCNQNAAHAADIHWNIPGCTEKQCKWPAHPGEVIGPRDGLPVHPYCAWGIVNEMDGVYKKPFREAGLGGVFRALGLQAINPGNWIRAIGSITSGGMQGLSETAARMVDWDTHLRPDCNNARSRDEILKVNDPIIANGSAHYTPIEAVCWNNIMDFRDLWCHYKNEIDVTKESECRLMFR